MVGAMSADQATQHPCQMKAPYSMAFPPAPVCSTEGEPLDRVHAAKKVSPRASRKRQARPIPLHTPIRTTTKERHRGTSRDTSRNTLARSSRMMSSIERRPWHDSTRNARYAALRRTSAAIAKLETAPRNRQVNDQSVISVSRHARRRLPRTARIGLAVAARQRGSPWLRNRLIPPFGSEKKPGQPANHLLFVCPVSDSRALNGALANWLSFPGPGSRPPAGAGHT